MVSVETSEACVCVYVELSKELGNCQQALWLKIAPVSMGGCLRREQSLCAAGARVCKSQLNMEII